MDYNTNYSYPGGKMKCHELQSILRICLVNQPEALGVIHSKEWLRVKFFVGRVVGEEKRKFFIFYR